MLTRRDWIKLTAGSALAASVPPWLRAADQPPPYIRDYEQPLFDLPAQVADPVIVESLELLRRGNLFFVRARTRDGAEGLIQTKQVAHFVPIFENRVAPRFIGRDAREIESLVDEVHRANYKEVGLPFWVCVAYCEQSILDALGKTAGKPVGALLGGVKRTQVPVYLSGSGRELSAEEEVDVYVRGVAETGAEAVKFKIGGRMSRNLDTYPGRTETLIEQSRQKLGDAITLYADANGSYNAKKGIEIGRRLEAQGYRFFEEPCPFEALDETQAVTQALLIPVAGGEQDSSLWRFQWMIDHEVVEIVQPDINYHGGFIRTLRVARMAEAAGLTIVPHNTQTGAASVKILQFASCTKNIGPHMEYPWRAPQRAASWYQPNFMIKDGVIEVPRSPGMGLTIDPEFIAELELVARIV